MGEVQLAMLALTLLDRLIDTSVTLARKDPTWQPKPLPTNFDDLVKAGQDLKAAGS
jgi:hypothetical protein